MLADILRLEEGCEKKTGKRSKDHVDVLHFEVPTRSMRKRMYGDVRSCCCWCSVVLNRGPKSGETVMLVVAVFSMVGCSSQPH